MGYLNRTNYMWFTPDDTLPSSAWNGACAEFCGASHANMRFRVYTVTPKAGEFVALLPPGMKLP